MPLPHDPGPHWGEVGIHGIHRQREWDAVVTVLAPDLTGDELWFAALEDGRVVLLDGSGDADALARSLDRRPPYRARAVRRDERVWAVAVRGIETVELESDPGGAPCARRRGSCTFLSRSRSSWRSSLSTSRSVAAS